MDLQLLPVERESEISLFTDVWLGANSSDNFQTAAYGAVGADVIKPWIETYFLQRYRTQPNIHHLKVIDTITGEVVAVGAWKFPATTRAEGTENARKSPMEGRKLPEGVNVSLVQVFVDRMMQMEGKLIDATCYELVTLATLPQFQSQGAGTMIVKWGLEELERTGGRSWIKSTLMAVKLYEKFGWKQVEELRLDLAPYGGVGEEFISFMCR